MQKQFVVSIKIPDGANVGEVKQYIYDAVQSWAGSLRPPGGYGETDEGDPLFGLDRSKIKVTIKQKIKRTK